MAFIILSRTHSIFSIEFAKVKRKYPSPLAPNAFLGRTATSAYLSNYSAIISDEWPKDFTFGKVFAWIDADEFQKGFMEWIKEIAKMTAEQVIASDGKTVRRSHDRVNGKKTLHLVSAWASKNEMMIGQRKIEDQSNEISANPELLKIPDIRGCIVTIDAIGMKKEIARSILEQKDEYILTVKRNQGNVFVQDI